MNERILTRDVSHPLLQREGQSPAAKSQPVNENTPLLNNGAAGSSSNNAQRVEPTTDARPVRRPGLVRAATAVPTITITSSHPLLSRPNMNRSTSATTLLFPQTQGTSGFPKPIGPSLLRRATDAVISTLDPTAEYSSAGENRPDAPSHWTNHAHRRALLSIWDNVQDIAGDSKNRRPIISQLVSTEKQMLEQFPELGEGDSILTRDWTEYVLGICMRHPFCTSEKMGRGRVLASGGGARGNWGPF